MFASRVFYWTKSPEFRGEQIMRRASSIRIPFALRDGVVVDIVAVARGLACACVCPSCGSPLIARKGPKVVHHFAHRNAECPSGLETTLHHMAKSFLEEAQEFWIPPVRLAVEDSPSGWRTVPGHFIPVHAVWLEARLGDIVPDVVVRSGQRHLFVEITVTHPVTEEKCHRARKLGVSVLEIDIGHLRSNPSPDHIRALIVGASEYKCWKVNLHAEAMLRSIGNRERPLLTHRPRLQEKVIRLELVLHGMALHAMECPIAIRNWHGQTYANVLDDCGNCKFFDGRDDRALYCRGYGHSIWEESRIEQSDLPGKTSTDGAQEDAR